MDPKPSREAVDFLRVIPGTEVEVLEATATAFLRNEMDSYDPRLWPALAPHCEPAYLDRHLLQGFLRAGVGMR